MTGTTRFSSNGVELSEKPSFIVERGLFVRFVSFHSTSTAIALTGEPSSPSSLSGNAMMSGFAKSI